MEVIARAGWVTSGRQRASRGLSRSLLLASQVEIVELIDQCGVFDAQVPRHDLYHLSAILHGKLEGFDSCFYEG
jgi:hypothetical protein